MGKQEKSIEFNASEIRHYKDQFVVLAECISILTENVNMQMEAEWADLFDRRLMSLYGLDSKNPTKMDIHGTKTKA